MPRWRARIKVDGLDEFALVRAQLRRALSFVSATDLCAEQGQGVRLATCFAPLGIPNRRASTFAASASCICGRTWEWKSSVPHLRSMDAIRMRDCLSRNRSAIGKYKLQHFGRLRRATATPCSLNSGSSRFLTEPKWATSIGGSARRARLRSPATSEDTWKRTEGCTEFSQFHRSSLAQSRS
jgi:hypothetical protein